LILVLPLFVAVDLLLAAQALPHTQTTAPQAVTDLRTAPAHLLTDPTRATLAPAAMGRFLGMSTITYDPGDMADWQRILDEGERPQLDEQAFAQFVIALKVQELIVPNLSLLWRIPSVDGFDGGVLPLQRYNEFLTLFVPREVLVPDGRLREQLRVIPPAVLLNLLNVQYLITDKVRDLWFEDVFYDRQIGARLDAALRQVTLEVPRPLEATHVDLIGFVDGDATSLQTLANQTLPVAELLVASADATQTLPLTAGGAPGAQLADGTLDSVIAQQSGATIAYRDVDGGRQEYRVRLELAAPTTPVSLTVQLLNDALALQVQAVTLYDARTKMFVPLLPSDRGRFQLVHSGDVKIYENLEVLPRAYLAHNIIGTTDSTQALETLRTSALLSDTAVVEGLPGFTSAPAPRDQAQIIAYAPEQVTIHVQSVEAALLVLSDTAYPGWTATVDGVATPIYTTNYLFRGVPVPPGEHTITFAYSPSNWQWGLLLSGIGLGLTVLLARRRGRARQK